MGEMMVLVLRWAGRLAALVLVGIVAVIVAGHGGLPNFLREPLPVQVQFLGLVLCVAGCTAGCRWELPGALLSIAGFALFVGTQLIVNGRFPGGLIPYFLVPAALFLAGAGLRARRRRFPSAGTGPSDRAIT